MGKHYTSFKAIEQDLRILKLRREIEMENLKLTYSEAKQSLYPTHLLGGFGGIVQKILITLVAKKIAARFSR